MRMNVPKKEFTLRKKKLALIPIVPNRSQSPIKLKWGNFRVFNVDYFNKTEFYN